MRLSSIFCATFGLFFFGNLAAQPLEFIDFKDSLGLLNPKLAPVADGGWISISTALDSSLTAIKFNFCGKVEWSRKLSTDGNIQEMNFVQSNKDIFIASVINNGNKSGIYCLNLDEDGNTQFPSLLSIDSASIYSNPRICIKNNQRWLGFNAGKDSAKLVFYLIRLTTINTVDKSYALNELQAMHDLISYQDNMFLATLGDKAVLQFDDQLTSVFAVNVNGIQFRNFGKTLDLMNDTSIILSGFVDPMMDTISKFHFIKLFQNLNIEKTSSSLPFLPELKMDYYILDGNIIASTILKRSTTKLISHHIFDENLNYLATKFNTLKPNQDSLISLNLNRNREGNFILNYTTNYKSQFKNIRLTKLLASACNDTTMTLIPQGPIFTDTSHLSFSFSSVPSHQIVSNVSRREFSPKLQRECEKFDLNDGVIPHPPVCRHDTVFLNGPQIENAHYMWDNGNSSNGISIKVDKSIELKLMITYCDKTITQTHKVDVKDCFPEVKFPNVASASATKDVNRVFLPYINEDEISKVKTWNLKIYNRWGQKVFEANKITDPWNLMYKGEFAAVDTYVFVAEGIDIYDDTKTFKGMVTILH